MLIVDITHQVENQKWRAKTRSNMDDNQISCLSSDAVPCELYAPCAQERIFLSLANVVLQLIMNSCEKILHLSKAQTQV